MLEVDRLVYDGFSNYIHRLLDGITLKQKIAYDCVPYLTGIKNLSTGKSFEPIHSVEFKWESITVPMIIIPPEWKDDLMHFTSQNIHLT